MTNEYEEKLIANFNNFILRDDLEEILKSTKKKGETTIVRLCRLIWLEATKQADERHSIK